MSSIYPLSAHKQRHFSSKQALRKYARSMMYKHIPQDTQASPPFHTSNNATHASSHAYISRMLALRNHYQSLRVCAYIESIITAHKFQHIALFYPLPHEPDILPLIKKLKQQGHKRFKVFLPTIQGLKIKMLPYRLPLVRNHFGIFEPRFSCQHTPKIQFVLIPSLGIDMAFQRIGMGKGMYDRAFSCHVSSPYRVCISQNFLISRTHITQGFDLSAHQYISNTLRMQNIKGFSHVMDSYHRISRIWASCRIYRLSRM